MKLKRYLLFVMAVSLFVAACQNVDFRKTKSGLLYKIFPSKGKDSLIRIGTIVKYHITYNLNDDSVLYTTHGKAPQFQPIQAPGPPYSYLELFPKLKEGDSLITVQMMDSLLKKGARVNFPTKKGDRIITTVKILKVFTVDSIARADFERENEKDLPRQQKEREEQAAKQKKEIEEQEKKKDEELEKSGEMARQIKEVEDYLARKNIKAQKIYKGMYVTIQQQGTGPAALAGKHVQVKYAGRLLRNDSMFQTSVYPTLQLGQRGVIRGWDEGLQLFKQGGKGTLYIPAFLAYGEGPGPGGKPAEALIFDIEMLQVSDSTIPQPQPAPPPGTRPTN